ncbi:MAG: hypothetical protein U0U67_16990 [Chitinophagales bacterium]
MLSKAKHLFLFILIFNLFSSCKNEIKQDTVSAETIINTDTLPVARTSIQKYPAWISEFQRLRQALYQNDSATLLTFFEFPLTDEQSIGLSQAIQFRTVDYDKYPVTYTVKTAKDIQLYFTKIFPIDLIRSLLPIKSDSLLASNFATTADWKNLNDEATYSTTISYEKSEQTLSIILNAAYGKDEEKTESAVVYLFKLNKNNALKFDKIVMAG